MKSEKEEKILKAAEKVFLKKGFFPTRIDDIAEEAGVAKGTIYLYFRDKQSIYVSILDNRLKEVIKSLENIKNEKSNATEKLEKIFNVLFDIFSDVKGMISLVTIENINLTTEIMKELRVKTKHKFSQLIDLLAKIIQEGIKHKELKSIDPKMGALIFLNIAHTSFQAHMFISGVKEQREKIKEIFFYGIKPNK
jgi:TetR/AcrR family fatty acid metabolism transcriptional regulator